MMCPKCQFDNREGAKFCIKCGAKFEVKCLNCGNSLPSEALFCDECGQTLSKRKEAASVDYSEPQSYTPKHLIDKILTSRSSIEGERKLVTVFFADVADYTSVSEKLDPEKVHQIMDGTFKIIMDEIHKYEGTINQFTGDGVMALFGAPVAHEDHAQRACYAALSIQKAMIAYGEKIKKDTGVAFKMRIGLNSGPVVVGAIGDDLRMDYTAVGDTTNLGSRMESLARPGTVLVSGNTHRLVVDFFEFKSLGKIEVKGKKAPQVAFELVKAGMVATRIGASVAKGLTRFVGRKNSLAALVDAFNKVKSGSGQVVGLLGEAGVGKSRLLLEMRSLLPQSEFSYLEGRCLQYGGSIAYLPVLDILRSYFDIKENEKEFVVKKKMTKRIYRIDKKLEGDLPAFLDLLAFEVEDEGYRRLEPQQKRDKIFKAIRDLIIHESQNKTIIVAIEDLHWIDKSSEEFLNYFIGWIARAKILLILLYRPEYTHQWGSKSYYNRISLDHLTIKSSTELLQAIFTGAKILPELKELILNRATGNPLYIEEFTHTLLENGSIQKKNERYFLTRKISDIQIPDSISGIIAARMDRLQDNLKRAMQEASVIGKDFKFRILQTITGMREEIKSILLNLQELEFIYEKTLFPELEYIFKHALTQEVAYNSLLIERRKEIHERIGKAIEQIYQDRLEEYYEILAYHFAKSDNLEKAHQFLVFSGKKATRNYSNWEALQFYREAIDVLGRMPSTDSNHRKGLQVHISLAKPAMFLSYPGDSIDMLKVGVKLAREVGDTRSIANLDGTLAHAYAIKGESILAIEHAEKCFQGAQKIQDIDLMAPVARDLTSAYMFAGELTKAVPIFSTVIPLIEKANKCSESFGRPASVYTFLCGLAGFIMGFLGSFNEAEKLCEKALINALQNNDIYELAYSEFSYGIAASQKGDGQLTVEHLQKCVDYLEQSQMTTLMDPALATLGLGYVYQADLEKAREYADRAIIAACQPGAATGNALITQVVLAMVYSEVGDLEKAHSCGTKAVKLSEGRMVGGLEGLTHFVLGSVLARMEKKRYEEAEECIQRALIILNEYELKPWIANGILTLGEIYAHSGKSKKAFQALNNAAGMFHEMGMDYWLTRTKSVLEKL